jgi:phosphoribosylanthranilate isomerase
MTAVKICGIRTPEHARAAVHAGAAMIGLVFAPSRRRVTPEDAAEAVAAARDAGHIRTVGVFVNEDTDRINDLVRLCDLDLVQLAGDEPDAVMDAIAVPVIRVIHVGPNTDRQSLGERIDASPASRVLLDTARRGSYGGTGETFDWSLIPPTRKGILLAGGLTAGNVGDAIRAARPWGVDVSGGVETDGVKDSAKITAFVTAARST